VFLKGWYAELPIYITYIGVLLSDSTMATMTTLKTNPTVYDLSQVLLCVILFLHQFMIMFVARESALIFIDERTNSSMSEMLRRRNLHISEYFPNKNADEGGEAQAEQDLNNTNVAEPGAERVQIFRISYQDLNMSIRKRTTNVLFGIVALLALLNFPKLLFISKFWAVVGSIVCPLIVIVIPGCFYYQVRKEQDEKKQYWRYWGIFYAVLGLLLLPVFLTLSTKNMFTGPFMTAYEPTTGLPEL